jgi:hypothetical protein
MNATSDDYQRALDGVLADLRGMDADVISVILYGSMADGSIVPGKSDIDLLVFLRQELLEDKGRYLAALEIMVTACKRLSRSGLPVLPFGYNTDIDSLSILFFPALSSEQSCKVVMGEDIRPRISQGLTRRASVDKLFFTVRSLQAHPLAVYLSRKKLTRADCDLLARTLIRTKKHLVFCACLALDIWVKYLDMPRELQNALPGVNMAVLESIKTLRTDPDSCGDAEFLLKTLVEMLVLIEEIHDRVLAKMKEGGRI